MNTRDEASALNSRDREKSERKVLGLIAGAGNLPTVAARLLRELGYSIRLVGFEGLTDPLVAAEVEQSRFLPLGRLEAMAKALSEMEIRQLLLLGKVPKSLLYEEGGIIEPDEEAIRLLANQRERADEPLMQAIAGWIESRGFELCDQGEILASLLAPLGSQSAREPSPGELEDYEIGRSVVARLGHAGVGQCVVVRQGSVLAVEAIEGTDDTIRRAGRLGGRGATVVKASRPGQDRRFDLPAIGVGTIEAMIDCGASALAVEAGSTLIIDRKAVASAADQADIAIWGYRSESSSEQPSW